MNQRILKFRAWDKEHSRMATVIDIQFKKGEPSWVVTWANKEEIGGIAEMFILLQYTDFCDKHKIEIYDGDIIRIPKEHGRARSVEWDIMLGRWGLGQEIDQHDKTSLMTFCFIGCEVIGDVYSNPELLKRG